MTTAMQLSSCPRRYDARTYQCSSEKQKVVLVLHCNCTAKHQHSTKIDPVRILTCL